MLKRYDELTAEQKKLVALMYSDHETLAQFRYNFDDKGKYIGRQFMPETGIIHAESIVPDEPKDEKPKAKRSHKK